MTAELDDRTVAYIVVAQSCFEDLKQVAGQLAGLLVLSAAGSQSAGPDHPLLKSAEEVYRQAADALGGVHVSARASLHHDHLLRACTKLGAVLRSLHARGDALPLLDSAFEDLRAASRTLPGFPMISFERGCCA